MRRRARNEVFRGADGWRWHTVAANRQITATSGEAFASRSNARRALRDYLISLSAVVPKAIADGKATTPNVFEDTGDAGNTLP